MGARTKISNSAETWGLYLPHILKELTYLQNWVYDRSSKMRHQKIFWQDWKKPFLCVQRALAWSILIRIGFLNLQHVAEHLLFQRSQMDVWNLKVWKLQSFRGRSLPIQISKFLITVKIGFGKLVNFILWFL